MIKIKTYFRVYNCDFDRSIGRTVIMLISFGCYDMKLLIMVMVVITMTEIHGYL